MIERKKELGSWYIKQLYMQRPQQPTSNLKNTHVYEISSYYAVIRINKQSYSQNKQLAIKYDIYITIDITDMLEINVGPKEQFHTK